MSSIQINELNTNSLNEVNEQEIKQVVGGLVIPFLKDDDVTTQIGLQLASNSGEVKSVFGGGNNLNQGIGQTLIQASFS